MSVSVFCCVFFGFLFLISFSFWSPLPCSPCSLFLCFHLSLFLFLFLHRLSSLSLSLTHKHTHTNRNFYTAALFFLLLPPRCLFLFLRFALTGLPWFLSVLFLPLRMKRKLRAEITERSPLGRSGRSMYNTMLSPPPSPAVRPMSRRRQKCLQSPLILVFTVAAAIAFGSIALSTRDDSEPNLVGACASSSCKKG